MKKPKWKDILFHFKHQFVQDFLTVFSTTNYSYLVSVLAKQSSYDFFYIQYLTYQLSFPTLSLNFQRIKTIFLQQV
jgi:hypothetical protein